MTQAIMVDLEFLALKPTAAILQIGMVKMDLEAFTVGAGFFANVSAAECMALGMAIDTSTVNFWADTNIKVLQRAMTGANPNTLRDILWSVRDFVGDDKPQMWACGNLDQGILDNAFSITGTPAPWNYYDWRDYRTLREEFGHDVSCPDPILPSHDALNDAKWQALHLIEIKKHIAALKGERV